MIATFTFDLDNDQDLYDTYRDAEKMHSVLWEFDHDLRRNIKEGYYNNMDGYDAAKSVVEMLHIIMLDKGFKFA